MKKKIIYTILIVSLIFFLPIFSGDAAISPDELNGSIVTPDSVYNYDGNTIEIIENTPQSTTILLNDTYILELEHNNTNVGIECSILGPPGIVTQANELLFDVDFETDPVDGQSIDITLPDMTFDLDFGGENNDEIDIGIIGEDSMDITYNTTSGEFDWTDGVNFLTFDGTLLDINSGMFLVYRVNTTTWDIATPSGFLTVNFNAGAGYMHIDFMAAPLYDGSIPPGPNPAPFYVDPTISIDWDGYAITIGGPGFSFIITTWILILSFDYIVFTWYWGIFIERLVIVYWDVTIVIYITVVELLIVIIYYTFEIKVYETSVVIIYASIEITFVFISILIWELIFVFYFEFWFIEIIFIVDIVLNIIIQPVRFVFIPVIVPVFIPVIFFVPVLIIQFIHIYVPYASPALHIDVFDEDLQMPTHTIQYFVYDQTGNPVNDAAVNVNYNGSDYLASFISNGIYQVQIPASDEVETITVTASKSWYPDGSLIYDLEVDWIIDTITIPTNVTVTETETPTAPLYLLPIISAIAIMATGTVLLARKKKK
jgi:hypothetical protein